MYEYDKTGASANVHGFWEYYMNGIMICNTYTTSIVSCTVGEYTYHTGAVVAIGELGGTIHYIKRTKPMTEYKSFISF